ncbi:hypothetical protein GGTG_02873 [Gaeumannomyces tritici R3-111a-1]|uniref:DUF202 domain-containing protein n=1 Tax=Gaeumannomyces tritici (strain R3-111a-1) TaxID=644352 RepID=J3NNL6_GAET3|nr:hypothetical protein GGTG_02873 [Gaeumannomyces tritici R3-111a-1]EJT77768.1 hypothetical protein GGTG_02873 [Gaeumannomyces tritici R3-111a-1]
MDPRRQDATCADVDEEDQTAAAVTCCAPARAALQDLTRPIDVGDFGVRRRTRGGGGGGGDEGAAFGAWPFLGPLLFENQTSDCRDHCANERTFLSYLRLAMFMALVSSAIVMSFHLKNEPSAIELRMAKPLGLVFWALSVACLALGLANYIRTVNKYGRRAALVQTGWKTQGILTAIVFVIVGTCVTLLVINRLVENGR